MAVYSPSQVGVKPPPGGFQQGGWYSGRQYWGGTLSDPGVIHPSSNQQGAGQLVSGEVNRQSSLAMGLSADEVERYLSSERAKAAAMGASGAPGGSGAGRSGAGSSYTPRVFTPEEQAMIDAAKGQYKAPSINLPELYKSLYRDSGIEGLSAELSTREKSYNDAVSKINDNPYYSEATRVGRLAKLEDQFTRDTQSLKNDVAMRKADIETQLSLQTKQFDIESEQAKQARDQFNTLLQLGALDNASGEDIAAIVRTTGMSSSMIQGAINANKEKNVQTSIQSYDDGVNQGFMVINSKTGDIISNQVVGASGSALEHQRSLELQTLKNADGGGSGGSSGGGGLTATQSRNVTSVARKAVQDVDSNKDRMLSQAEYTRAVEAIMTQAGVDFSTADDYAGKAFGDLGYRKWKW